MRFKSDKMRWDDYDNDFQSRDEEWCVCRDGLKNVFGKKISKKGVYRLYASTKKIAGYHKLTIKVGHMPGNGRIGQGNFLDNSFPDMPTKVTNCKKFKKFHKKANRRGYAIIWANLVRED